MRYVAYRDSAAPQGRLFDDRGTVGDRERKQVTAYIRRSIASLSAGGGRPGRAVYRMVLSPEDARGLDLRALTRATMAQLAEDAGELPPWIAAEHRNTAHTHVHIVLTGQREVAPGRFRELVITRQRLANMKGAMQRELDRQRGLSLEMELPAPRRQRHPRRQDHIGRTRRRRRPTTPRLPALRLGQALQKVARHYRTEQEQQLERERAQRGYGRER